ncbi:hypothetical protein JHK85_007174 [Glycine max]|nr:hypothetical protein JHK87_006814 [Glycine soja]KAG5054664.1 hypothetical protein JHK85_007174 [Glycine max]KAG5071764.1 hypothetical protein JHK86_006975 [Glycine max]
MATYPKTKKRKRVCDNSGGHCKEVRACKLQGAQGGNFQSVGVHEVLHAPKISCCLVDLNYWDTISTLVGEVVLGYFSPILVATGVVPLNKELWTNGYVSIIVDIVGGVWLRWWLQAATAMSNMEMFVAEMSSDSF